MNAHLVATPAGPFAVSLGRNIWTNQRFLIAVAGEDRSHPGITLRGRMYRMTLRLEERASGRFEPIPDDGLIGWPSRQLPDGRWISGDVLLPADRDLLPGVSDSIAAWAQDRTVELVHDTVAECWDLLASLSEERLEREAQVTLERERLSYLGERGWNTSRVTRRLSEHEEWLGRCDRWRAQAHDTIARFELVHG